MPGGGEENHEARHSDRLDVPEKKKYRTQVV